MILNLKSYRLGSVPAISIAVFCLLMLSTAAFAQLPSPSNGWNLGNTLEPPSGVGSWSPMPTQALINSVAKAGFNTIRIPCAWMSNSDLNGNINPTYMSEVKQVVSWCTADGLYVIVNDHWDGGWFEDSNFNTYSSTINSKLQYMWSQIAAAFNGYNNHVLFACANEPAVSSAAQTAVLFQYYQNFVSTIRGTGGNNATRWLVVEGPSTNIDDTYNWVTAMPSDPAHHLMLEVHYYDPYQFALMSSDQSWGNMFYFWGSGYHSSTLPSRNATWGEESYVNSEFNEMQSKFVNAGIPVLIGEWRAEPKPAESDLTGANIALNYDACTYWDKYIHDAANSRGMFCTCWDTSGQCFNWTTGAIQDQTQINALLGKSVVLPPSSGTLIANGTYTIVGVQSGSALDDPGWSSSSGTQMDIWSSNGGSNQQWALTNLGNNVVTLVNVASGLALEVSNGSKTNGASVDQSWWEDGSNQQWQVVQVSPGVYNLQNVNSGQVLDVVGARTGNGTLVDQWPSNGQTNQQWKFQ